VAHEEFKNKPFLKTFLKSFIKKASQKKAFSERTTFLEENFSFLSTGSFFRKKVFCKKKKCFGIRLSPVLIVLSVFTISLAISAYVRRSRIPEEGRFSVMIGRFIYDSHKYK